MPGYGVPATSEGLLPWSWAQDRLVSSRNYWVVTASASCRPHASPVWGVWLTEREQFAFSCSPASRKARNLRVNPQLSVAADDTVESVIVEGRAEALTGEPAEQVMTAWLEKYWPDEADRPSLDTFVPGNDVFVLTPERAFGMIERAEEFSERATRWAWA